MNYFQLLELEPRYDINQNLLRTRYLAKQVEYHPDRAEDSSTKVKNLEMSMLLNKAYKALSNDCTRAEYLLELNGFELNDKELSLQISSGELEDILSEYEEIEKMEDIADLQAKEQKKLAIKAELMKEITKNFNRNNFTKALDLTVRLKYLTNLVGNIKFKIKHASNRD